MREVQNLQRDQLPPMLFVIPKLSKLDKFNKDEFIETVREDSESVLGEKFSIIYTSQAVTMERHRTDYKAKKVARIVNDKPSDLPKGAIIYFADQLSMDSQKRYFDVSSYRQALRRFCIDSMVAQSSTDEGVNLQEFFKEAEVVFNAGQEDVKEFIKTKAYFSDFLKDVESKKGFSFTEKYKNSEDSFKRSIFSYLGKELSIHGETLLRIKDAYYIKNEIMKYAVKKGFVEVEKENVNSDDNIIKTNRKTKSGVNVILPGGDYANAA